MMQAPTIKISDRMARVECAGAPLRLFDRLFDDVWLRKTYHLVGGGLVAAAIPALGTFWFPLLCVFGLVAFRIAAKRVSTVLVGLLLVDVLSGSQLTTLGAAVVFVVGDGLAALVGTRIGATKLPFNEQKTVAGSVAFLIGAWVALFAVLYVTTTALGARDLLVLSALPSLAGCVAEAVPQTLVRDIRDQKPDDNLAVVLSSAAVLRMLIVALGVPSVW